VRVVDAQLRPSACAIRRSFRPPFCHGDGRREPNDDAAMPRNAVRRPRRLRARVGSRLQLGRALIALLISHRSRIRIDGGMRARWIMQLKTDSPAACQSGKWLGTAVTSCRRRTSAVGSSTLPAAAHSSTRCPRLS